MREPDLQSPLQSPLVRAWRVRNTDAAKAAHVESLGYADAGIDQWLVNGRFHPMWSWWMVAVIHLRDVPGAPPAFRQYPEAEYEFAIRSLNPDPEGGRPPAPDVDLFEETGDAMKALPGFLTPPDAVVHFHGLTDEQAAELCELSVRAIVGGRASPDSDWREWWEKAVPNTVKHLRGEPH